MKRGWEQQLGSVTRDPRIDPQPENCDDCLLRRLGACTEELAECDAWEPDLHLGGDNNDRP